GTLTLSEGILFLYIYFIFNQIKKVISYFILVENHFFCFYWVLSQPLFGRPLRNGLVMKNR
ncbi:hypothetical protein, partial [Oceanobacillus oncorhynchi]|uniref:hypothetical protein n=1 Tax=Oceanobacillus oncorhynchi TaxID=545501 RepID=UPI001D02AB84